MPDPIARTHFLPEYSLEIWQPVGVLNNLMAALVVSYISFEEWVRATAFNRYVDLSRLEAIDLDLRYVTQIGTERCSASAALIPVKSAIFAPERKSDQVARVFAKLMGSSPIDVRVFSVVEEAARWLGVPTSSLE